MLLITEDEQVLNSDYIVVIWINKIFKGSGCDVSRYDVKCDLENGDRYVIKSCETEREAKEVLEWIISQCNRGQRVIRIK